MEIVVPAPVRRPEALGLSPRQQQVLERIAQGKSNLVIAWELGISQSTVENHKIGLCRKLRVRNSRELLLASTRAVAQLRRGKRLAEQGAERDAEQLTAA